MVLLARAGPGHGAGPGPITRMTWHVTDERGHQRQSPAIALAYGERIGRHPPPMAAVAVEAPMHDEAPVEIEVTAVLEDDA